MIEFVQKQIVTSTEELYRQRK